MSFGLKGTDQARLEIENNECEETMTPRLPFFVDPRNLDLAEFEGVCRREARDVGV